MSYEIEYEKKAYRALDKHGEEVFFTYVTTCSNNVDPRTPRPRFFKAGRRYEIIQRACEFAGDCESGCWKPKNRWVSPESYIRRWRKVLKEAVSLEVLHGRMTLRLTMKQAELKDYLEHGGDEPINPNPDKYRWNQITELLKELPRTDTKMYNESYTFVEIRVKTYADVERAVELESHLKEIGLLAWSMEIKF